MNYNDQQHQFMMNQQQSQQIRQNMPPQGRMLGQPGMMNPGMRQQYMNQAGQMPHQMQQSTGMPPQQQIQQGMPPMNRPMTNPMSQMNRSGMPQMSRPGMPQMINPMQQQPNQEGSPYNPQHHPEPQAQHNTNRPMNLTVQDVLAQMPPEARRQFEAETDKERKNAIFKHFSQRIQMHHHQQNQINQQGNQNRMQMEHNRPPNFPQQIQRVPSQGTFQMNSAQPQFQMNSAQPQFQMNSTQPQQYLVRTPQQQPTPQPVQNVVLKHSPMPSQSVPSSGNLPSQRTGGPPSSGNIQQPRSIHSNYANSPQINQPPSVQNVTVPTPRPAPTPAPVIDTNDPEYKKLVGELKSYQKDTKILLERVRIDGHETLEKSLLRVLEVMEGKRDVDIKLLNKLLSNLKNSIRQHNPMKTMLDFSNRVNVVPQTIDSPILPEGWDQLDQFKIKVPSPVLKHVEKVKEQSRKRKISDDSLDDKEAYCEVSCVYQNSVKLKLSKEVTDELLCYNFSIDPSGTPISEYVANVQILVEFKPKELESFKYSIPPLRLNIPANDYPTSAIQLVTMHEDYSALQLRIIDALKKNTNDEIMHSITKLIALWRKTVTQIAIPSTDTETRRLITAQNKD